MKEFNQRRYFQAHELWEALWMGIRGPEKEFYQGLIQLAVACHHLSRGNLQGARKVFTTAQKYLQPFLSTHPGFDLNALIHQIGQCIDQESSADLPLIPAA